MAKNPLVAERELIRGAARFADLVYIICRAKTLIAQDIAHSSVIAVDQGDWGDAGDPTTWNATAIAVARLPAEKMILVGEDGDVMTYVGGASTTEKLKPAPVMIRNACEIGGHVYACGMKRQVYKRSGEKKWVAMNAPAAAATEKFGFEAIHGFSDEEIYAVGWGGEIWQYDGKRWTSRTSGVEHTLTAVCCAGDDEVYVAGVHGTLLRGRNDTWQSIPTTATADLWDLCWFEDRLYVATMTGLFVLDGKKLVPVKFGKEKPATCYSLSTSEGVLWSVGRDDVASFDGKKWQTY